MVKEVQNHPGEPIVFTREKLIEWSECDPAGIVYYPRFFEMFDANTNALFKHVTGIGKRLILKKYEIVGWPMISSAATFNAPVTYGDEVHVSSYILKFGTSSMEICHKMINSDGALIAEGTDKRVWVGKHPDNPQGIKAKPLPKDFTEQFFMTKE